MATAKTRAAEGNPGRETAMILFICYQPRGTAHGDLTFIVETDHTSSQEQHRETVPSSTPGIGCPPPSLPSRQNVKAECVAEPY